MSCSWPAEFFRYTPPLFGAAGDRMGQLGRRFSSDRSELDTGELLMMAGALAGAIAVVFVLRFLVRWILARRERNFHNPRRLLLELCRTHDLSKSDCQLVREIAAWHALPQPAILFIDRKRWQSPQMRAELGRTAEIDNLAERLFSEAEN
jgi:hypothetical protein